MRLSQIAAAWRQFDPEAAGGLYAKELKEMAREFGMARVEKALDRAISSRQYLPTISELRDDVGSVSIGGPKLRCRDCYGLEGWIRVQVIRNGKTYEAVKRCTHTGQATEVAS